MRQFFWATLKYKMLFMTNMKKKEVSKIKSANAAKDNLNQEVWIESLNSWDFEDYMDDFATK